MKIIINNLTGFSINVKLSSKDEIFINDEQSYSLEIPQDCEIITIIILMLSSNESTIVKFKIGREIEIYQDNETFNGNVEWIKIDNHSITLFELPSNDDEGKILTEAEFLQYIKNISNRLEQITSDINNLNHRIDKLNKENEENDQICIII